MFAHIRSLRISLKHAHMHTGCKPSNSMSLHTLALPLDFALPISSFVQADTQSSSEPFQSATLHYINHSENPEGCTGPRCTISFLQRLYRSWTSPRCTFCLSFKGRENCMEARNRPHSYPTRPHYHLIKFETIQYNPVISKFRGPWWILRYIQVSI